jgi:hypothetical protein
VSIAGVVVFLEIGVIGVIKNVLLSMNQRYGENALMLYTDLLNKIGTDFGAY